MKISLEAFMVGLLSASAVAAPSGHVDLVDYDATSIVAVEAAVGYAVHISLDAGERIESVAVGDAEHWIITARDGAHDIYLKPRVGAANTNLEVRTDQRAYSFVLRVTRLSSPTFRVEFRYPTQTPMRQDQHSVSSDYSMQIAPGSKAIAPIRAFDDDRNMFLTFATHAAIPAAFEVLDDGTEQLLNHHTEGDVLIIHRVVHQLALRLGSQVVSVFKDEPPRDRADQHPPSTVPLERIDRMDAVTGAP